ncbi:hypothetical protein Trydic_g17478 [Trypoxylus dichotomus]
MSNGLPKEDILQFGLQYYRFVGENISYTPRKLYIYRFLNIFILITILCCVIENCIREEGLHLIKGVEAIITIFHILIKYILFIHNKSEINAVISDRLKFWQPDPNDLEQGKFWRRLHCLTKIQQAALLIAVIISMDYYMLKPYFNSLDVFPFPIRTHRSEFWTDVALLVMQYYCLWMVTATVMTYDVTYFALCIHIIVQLRLLTCKLSHKTTNMKEELRTCIVHHQLQSRVFLKLQGIYSWMLMVQYFMCLIMTCVQLYILSTRKVGIADTFELVLYVVSMYSQFGYYSIPVEAIHSGFAEVGNAVYMSTWYENEVVTQKHVLAMMTYAQNSKYLTGCGIILINVDAFGSVFRKSFSLYVALKNLL